jgi:hypothetical protein
MSKSPSRIGKGIRAKNTAIIDENFNDDINNIFKEDESNMRKIASRNQSRTDKQT